MNDKFEEIEKRINEDNFYEYDLKEEIIREYKRINGLGYLTSKKGKEEQILWKEKKAFNSYISRINVARKAIENLNSSYLEIFNSKDETKEKYIYLKRYLLFRYQADKNKKRKIYFDCDASYLVYQFYKSKFNYFNDLNGQNSYKPQYFDTYFSVQSIWGKFINNLFDKKGRDFEWQIENFDKITGEMEKEDNLRALLEAFNQLTHFYHTIGNIAPCAPRINSPKGLASFCYDRIDLFLQKEIYENWLKWYYGNEVKISNISENDENNTNKFYLQDFLNVKDLGEVKIPENKEDKDNIVKLTNYINNIVDLIKKRGKNLKSKGELN